MLKKRGFSPGGAVEKPVEYVDNFGVHNFPATRKKRNYVNNCSVCQPLERK